MSYRILLLLMLLCLKCTAQEGGVTITCTDRPQLNTDLWYKNKARISDSTELIKVTNQIIKACRAEGRLAASIDSITIIAKNYHIYVFAGPIYKWSNLKWTDTLVLPPALRDQILISSGKVCDIKSQLFLMDQVITYYENNGFPFVRVHLKDIQLTDSIISAFTEIDLYKPFYFDTIDYGSEAALKKNFLYQYLGIKPGTLYSEELIQQIEPKLSQLNYISITKAPIVYFKEDKVYTLIFLENQTASSFDGIAGFAPSNDITGDKLLLTGELHVKLQNLLKKGISAEMDFRSFRGNSQELSIKNSIPYLFRTQLGSDIGFQLTKFDSIYIDVQYEIGARYALKGNNYLKTYFKQQSVNLLVLDTPAVLISKRLPEFHDIIIRTYGITGKYIKTDYIRNPRRGVVIDIDVAAGTRQLQPISLLDKEGLYKDLKMKTLQFKSSVQADLYIPVLKNSCIHLLGLGGIYKAPGIFYNELFRIGGIKTLKGFDEQSIFASSYAIMNLEYRYIFTRNSYATVFANGAWWERNSNQGFATDTPYGFGAGGAIDIGRGILSLYYALGKQFQNPIEVKKGKVHFGFINYF